MDCWHEGCERVPVNDGNYCDRHQWEATIDNVRGLIIGNDQEGTRKGGGPDKSKGADEDYDSDERGGGKDD